MTAKKCFHPAIILSVLAGLLLSAGLSAQIAYNEGDQKLRETYKRANPLYLKANKFLGKNDLKQAEAKAMECLALMPEHANATFLIAQLQLKRQEFPKALETIVKAKENFKLMAGLITFTHQEYMDSLRSRIEGLEQAKNNYEEILAALGQNTTARAQYEGHLVKVNAQIDAVRNQLREPIPQTFDIPSDYHYIHGNILFRLRRHSEAVEQYNRAIEADPTHSNAYNNLSLALFSLNRFDEAMDCLIRAEAAGAKVNPDFKKALTEKIAQKTPAPAG